MHGIVSLLDEKHFAQVESLWKDLEETCGLKGIKVTPFPHFSWQIGEDYDWNKLELALSQIASRTKPFTIQTTGIALFSGEQPVIFIPVVRDPSINAFHNEVWQTLQTIGRGISSYYAPQSWMPHISLAYSDVTRENINCVIQMLAFQTFNWKILVDNISAIYEPSGRIGTLRLQVPFLG
jgi:hypothetical protein